MKLKGIWKAVTGKPCCGRYWFHHFHVEQVSEYDMPADPHCQKTPDHLEMKWCEVCCRCGQLGGYPAGVTV